MKKLEQVLAENMRRFSTKNLREGVRIGLVGVIPNVDYFTKNPTGTLVVDDIGSVLQSVNNEMVDEDNRNNKMYSDQLVRGGEYQYQFVPNVKTMRAPAGEPVVNLMQNGKPVNSFMPIK